MFHDMVRDGRYALRQFSTAPTFTLVATLTLALGVGANAAIFSVVNGLLLRPLPYPQPERLLFVDGVLSRPEGEVSFQLSYPDVQDIRAQSKTLALISPWATAWGLTLGRDDGAERLDANFVGRDYFSILGATPLLGRTFTPEDHALGADAALLAILSEATWRQQFGADPAIIGRDIRLQDRAFTVIGVMPESFSDLPESTGDRVDVWAPIERAPALFGSLNLSDRSGRLMWGVARLADGADHRVRERRAQRPGRAHCGGEPRHQQELLAAAGAAVGPILRGGAPPIVVPPRRIRLRPADRLRQRGQLAARPIGGSIA